MDGDTQRAQRAAFEMTTGSTEDLRRELINEGIYTTLIEGGFHMQTLSDAEADYLVKLISRDGIRALSAYGEPGEPMDMATVTFIPEVWQNDYPVASDDTITFRVPLEDAVDENGDLLADRSGDSDALKHHSRAPLSVQHYPGPYSIELEY
jgi:hypothetical protein